MSTMNRRAVLAGAAALPASTLHDASRPADADGARRPVRRQLSSVPGNPKPTLAFHCICSKARA
jgi:hypothetical protein